MKTLINKVNHQIRITMPEITESEYDYEIIVKSEKSAQWIYLSKDFWTLVDEYNVPNLNNGTFTFVNTEEEPAEGIKGNLEEIPPKVDLEKVVEMYRNEHGYPEYLEELKRFAKYFYELGQCKSEFTIAATEEELKKAMEERYPMPENADALTRDKIAAARNGFLSGYSWELGRKGGKI